MNPMPNKLPYEEFISIYSKVPRLCFDMVIHSEEGILLSLRDIDPGKGLWHFPGGTMLMGETFEQVVRRITKEETGLSVTGMELAGTMEFPDPSNPFYHSVSIVFNVKAEGKLTGSYQGQKLEYFKELPDMMIEEHKKFLLEHIL
jgi:ADP-ribose pyrophosphatase YjhB (NUDIX family)